MWAFLFGWMFGSAVRNSSLPDSVKQERYDAKQKRKAQHQGRWAAIIGGLLIIGLIAIFPLGALALILGCVAFGLIGGARSDDPVNGSRMAVGIILAVVALGAIGGQVAVGPIHYGSSTTTTSYP